MLLHEYNDEDLKVHWKLNCSLMNVHIRLTFKCEDESDREKAHTSISIKTSGFLTIVAELEFPR